MKTYFILHPSYEELSELQKECFGRKYGSECWPTERMAKRNA